MAEPVIYDRSDPHRIRRVSDLLRLVGALGAMGLIVLPGILEIGTIRGISDDITNAVTTIPELVVGLLSQISQVVVTGLPLFVLGALIWRRRWRSLAVAVVTGFGAAALASVINSNARSWFSPPLYSYLTNTPGLGPPAPVALGLFASVVAIATVDGQGNRARTGTILWVALGGLGALSLIDNSATLPALALSVLGGYSLGLFVRYLVGTENPRLPSKRLLETVIAAGLPVARMAQKDDSDQGRTYSLELLDGSHARAQVFDPDRRASQAVTQLVRSLRFRTWVTRRAQLSSQAALSASAAPVLMATNLGVRTPRLLVAADVDRTTAIYVEESPSDLRTLAQMEAGTVTTAMLGSLWDQIELLQKGSVSHDRLSPEALAVDPSGRGWLLELYGGQIGASSLRMRLDRAEMLLSTACVAELDDVVDAAEAEFGAQDVARLPAFMQTVALNPHLRSHIKAHPQLIENTQAKIEARSGADVPSDTRFERVRVRNVVGAIAATIAVYVLAGQLGSVNFKELFSKVNWAWAAVALGGSTLSYFGAALTIRPFSPVKIPFKNWIAAQLAASFVVLVAPAAVGSAGMNTRLIQKGGANPALAVAAVGISTVVSVLTSVTLLIVLGFVSQSETNLAVKAPSEGILLIIGAVVLFIAALVLIPATRKALLAKIVPIWKTTVPRILEIVRDPVRLLSGASGNILTSLGYTLAMVAAVRAYGAELHPATAALVVLGSGLVGTVAPTPGGLGAVEAALIGGLTATGLPNSVAVWAALLYRTVTFWIPTVPGWVAFHYLQKQDAI